MAPLEPFWENSRAKAAPIGAVLAPADQNGPMQAKTAPMEIGAVLDFGAKTALFILLCKRSKHQLLSPSRRLGPHQHSVDTPVCLPPRRRSYLVLLRAGITSSCDFCIIRRNTKPICKDLETILPSCDWHYTVIRPFHGLLGLPIAERERWNRSICWESERHLNLSSPPVVLQVTVTQFSKR